MDFFIKWQNKSLLPLSVRNTKKLTVIINVMAKLLMKQAFWPLVIFLNILLAGPMIIAYFDPNSKFMIVSMVFFQVNCFIFIVQSCCFVCAGFTGWSFAFIYLLLKFKEIHQDIQHRIKLNDHKGLWMAIIHHDQLVIETRAIDRIFKWVVFILYYVCSPALMMLVCICQIPVTIPMARPVCAIIAISICSVVF